MIKDVVIAYKSKGLIWMLLRIAGKCKFFLKKKYYFLKFKSAEIYKNPTVQELKKIEVELIRNAVTLGDLSIDSSDFENFQTKYIFPEDYHGGKKSGVWEEKLFEHYIAWKMLDISSYEKDDIYIDVAACDSPWAKMLRDVNKTISSFAIDLNLPTKYANFPYYKQMDATKTNFENNSVRGVSLQCAYEMFVADSDINLIKELHRILKGGGKAIISPLYMHTHPCHYASPDYYGKGYGDIGSKEYILWNYYGICSSRKYDAKKLKDRILDLIESLGMKYKIYILKNKSALSSEIYMHFILEIEK